MPMGGAKRSRTAQGVAAERAVLCAMGIVDDSYAKSMLTRPWSMFVEVKRRCPAHVLPFAVTFTGLAARVLWYDAQVRAALGDGFTQVAVIGAGYDTRAWRFGRDGVKFFELDHPVTQADKRRRAPRPGPTFVEADLATASAADSLIAHGLDASQPVLVIIEGVTMYLTRDVVEEQLGELARSAGPGSRLALDFYPPSDVGTAKDRRQILGQRLFRVGSGEGFKLVVDPSDAADLVRSCGWEIDEVTNLRAAANALVPRESRLPRESVNEYKALVAARI